MDAFCALLLAKSDYHHLADAALIGTAESIVGLDPAGNNDSVGLMRIFILINRFSILRISQEHRFHGRSDRASHGLFCNSVTGKKLFLALCLCTSMASHGRNDKRICPLFFHIINDCTGNYIYIGNAPASGRDRDIHSRLDPGADFRSGKLFSHNFGNLLRLNPVFLKALLRPEHFGDWNILQQI